MTDREFWSHSLIFIVQRCFVGLKQHEKSRWSQIQSSSVSSHLLADLLEQRQDIDASEYLRIDQSNAKILRHDIDAMCH